MFVVSVKMSRRRWVSLLLCVGVLVLILAAAFLWPAGGGTAVSTAAEDTAARIAFLNTLGYEVDPAYCEVCEIHIPEEFDAVFSEYNAMQAAADMDLTPYQGKRVKCWSYRILNSGNTEETIAHLYVYRDEIVGGDITETVQNGRTTALVPRG
ncbi:MAG: DUF4830 domain-containing protein [Ruminococcaceae bacterium]|nr:DUF4830 domain-containing protein [Oscillospiraceae bacterium]